MSGALHRVGRERARRSIMHVHDSAVRDLRQGCLDGNLEYYRGKLDAIWIMVVGEPEAELADRVLREIRRWARFHPERGGE